MKIKKGLFILVFFIVSLAFSADGYSKGGGKGGGGSGGRGGKSSGGSGYSHKGGHHQHPPKGFSRAGIGFYSRGYGYPGYWDSPRSGCDSCHPNLKWYDRFGSCKYRELNLRKAEEHRAMVERYIRSGQDIAGHSNPFTGR